MIFLSLDTSTKYSVVSLSDENGLICGASHLYEKGRLDEISNLISLILKKSKRKIQHIDCFGVGIGPGSFTGLRIGISTIKALSYAYNKLCFSFSSLDAIAFNKIPAKVQNLCVIVDARRSSVYCKFYKFSAEGIVRSSQDALVAVDSLDKKIKKDMWISGDALRLYKDKFLVKSVQFVAEEFWYPTTESISLLALESFKKGEAKDCFKLSANYLYKHDCQVSKTVHSPQTTVHRKSK